MGEMAVHLLSISVSCLSRRTDAAYSRTPWPACSPEIVLHRLALYRFAKRRWHPSYCLPGHQRVAALYWSRTAAVQCMMRYRKRSTRGVSLVFTRPPLSLFRRYTGTC